MTRYRLDAEVDASEGLLRLLKRARRLVAFYKSHGIAMPSALLRMLGDALPGRQVTDEKTGES